MKKYIILCIAMFCVSSTYAQEQETDIQTGTDTCNYYNTIQGPVDIQVNSEKTYTATLEGSGGVAINTAQWLENSTFEITHEKEKKATFSSVSSFAYNFDKSGIYSIKHQTTYKECVISTTATVVVYDHSIRYIGEERGDLTKTIINNLKQRSTLLHQTIPTKETTTESGLSIKDSQIVIIDSKANISLQKILTNIEKSLSPKSQVILISDASISLNKKIFGPITKQITQPVRIISNQKMTELILLRRTGERQRGEKIINQSPQINNYNTHSIGLNTFIDKLLLQGIPLPIIASIITLTFITLLLVFLRQVIGVEVFSIYYPILGAITLLLVGSKLSLILFGIARFAQLCTQHIARNLNILLHAKIGIYIVTYATLSIVVLGTLTLTVPEIDRSYTQHIGTRGILGGFVSVLVIGQRLFKPLQKRTRQIINILTYITLIVPIAHLLSSTNIQYRMITHTWSLFFIMIITIGLGRFTGMKLLEYQRFWKLLWKEMRK